MMSAHTYLKNSISLANDRKYWAAFQHMDFAIMLSKNRGFYFYQKIKMLYSLNFHEDCMQLILSQLKFLYNDTSLYLFSKILLYYEEISQCTKDELIYLLIKNEIPKCLAYEYSKLVEFKHVDFYKKATQAKAKQHYTLAIAYCDLNIKQNKITQDVLFLRAYSYHCLGDFDQSRRAYLMLIEKFPNYSLGYNNFALCLMENQHYSAAEDYFKKALELDPTNVHYTYNLSECYSQGGKYELAVSNFTSLLGSSLNQKQLYYHLYYANKKLNNRRLAKKYYKLWYN